MLGIRRVVRVPNARIKKLCRVVEGIDESVLHWFGPVERIEKIGFIKRCMWESVWVVP